MKEIRRLTIDDLDEIIELRINLQNIDLNYYIDNSYDIALTEEEMYHKTKEYIKSNLDNTLYMFGIFIDNKLVANCGFYLDRHFPTYTNKSGMIGHICNVYTKEDCRKKGYMKELFAYSFRYAKELGVTKFQLNSKNETAIKMYKSFGFKKKNSVYYYEV